MSAERKGIETIAIVWDEVRKYHTQSQWTPSGLQQRTRRGVLSWNGECTRLNPTTHTHTRPDSLSPTQSVGRRVGVLSLLVAESGPSFLQNRTKTLATLRQQQQQLELPFLSRTRILLHFLFLFLSFSHLPHCPLEHFWLVAGGSSSSSFPKTTSSTTTTSSQMPWHSPLNVVIRWIGGGSLFGHSPSR